MRLKTSATRIKSAKSITCPLIFPMALELEPQRNIQFAVLTSTGAHCSLPTPGHTAPPRTYPDNNQEKEREHSDDYHSLSRGEMRFHGISDVLLSVTRHHTKNAWRTFFLMASAPRNSCSILVHGVDQTHQ